MALSDRVAQYTSAAPPLPSGQHGLWRAVWKQGGDHAARAGERAAGARRRRAPHHEPRTRSHAGACCALYAVRCCAHSTLAGGSAACHGRRGRPARCAARSDAAADWRGRNESPAPAPVLGPAALPCRAPPRRTWHTSLRWPRLCATEAAVLLLPFPFHPSGPLATDPQRPRPHNASPLRAPRVGGGLLCTGFLIS